MNYWRGDETNLGIICKTHDIPSIDETSEILDISWRVSRQPVHQFACA